MLHDLPVIDISPLRDGSSAARAAVAGAMGKACRETGFFYITSHGVTPDTMTKLFEASRSFFSQPAAAKDAISMKRVGKNRGYVGLGVERLDTTSLPDRKEAFNISPNEPDGVEAWPALPGWRDLMLKHFATCRDIGAALHRGFARDLGVDENFFVDKFRNPLATLRLLRYPAAPVPPRPPPRGDRHDRAAWCGRAYGLWQCHDPGRQWRIGPAGPAARE